ncbi:MAG: ORF6N domain-containing protein [Candidatus Desulfaltia sp.]|nr:ORF6N domain-containing protein [Candidatus Desulfaltia sp.]
MKKDIIMSNVVTMETITGKICLIRGMKVLLDADLAELYGVTTKALNQAVTRNEQRFPPDFMFRLAKEEKQELVTNCDRLDRLKHSSALPRVFTEQGVAMLSSVLRSERAIHVNIQIMRVFTRLRQMVLDNKELRKEFEKLKQITDERFQIVFETLDQLIKSENKPKKKIGFTVKEKLSSYGN